MNMCSDWEGTKLCRAVYTNKVHKCVRKYTLQLICSNTTKWGSLTMYCKLTLKITEKGSHLQVGSHSGEGRLPGESRGPGVEKGMG